MRNDPYDPNRLDEANQIVATLIQDAKITITNRGVIREHVVLDWKGGRTPLVPCGTGAHLTSTLGGTRFGGTVEDALATLVRFIRGRTRRPLAWWELSFGEGRTLATLKGTSYHDPSATCCVLCKEDRASSDWWYSPRERLVGPCCFYGRCPQPAPRRARWDDEEVFDFAVKPQAVLAVEKRDLATECPGHERGGQGEPCCEKFGQYNGFGSDGPLAFTCPKRCSCHD